MARRTAAHGIGTRWLAGAALCAAAMALAGGCAREEPTAPQGSYSLSGRVSLIGYLVDVDGRFVGNRVVNDADGVDVELRHGSVSRHSTTVDGVYSFSGLSPGLYTVRATVIGALLDETNSLTIVKGDLVAADTIRIESFGDILPFPNPASDFFSLAFELSNTQHVDLRVQDLQGNMIQVITSETLQPGRKYFYWNCRDGAGNPVSGSLYWVTLQTGNEARAHLLFRE